MKTGIHPDNYRLVVFEDLNNKTRFLIKSTAGSKETAKWEDGRTYPLVRLHVTSASHPFYTGQEKVIDIEGRIDKFQARTKSAQLAKQQRQAKTLKTMKQTATKTARAKTQPLRKQMNKKNMSSRQRPPRPGRRKQAGRPAAAAAESGNKPQT